MVLIPITRRHTAMTRTGAGLALAVLGLSSMPDLISAAPMQDGGKAEGSPSDWTPNFKDGGAGSVHPLARSPNGGDMRYHQFIVSPASSASAVIAAVTSSIADAEGSVLNRRAFVPRADPTTAVSGAKASSTTASQSSSSGSPTASTTGFTLTDTHNKLYPVWIGLTILATLAGLFIVLCGLRWCFFRPSKPEDPDSILTGGNATSRKGGLRNGAKSLRKALTKHKLAGASFARRQTEGSVLLEVGDEVYAVSPSIAAEYNEGKRLFGQRNGGSLYGAQTWNGKAFLAQCLARHEAQRTMDKLRQQSGSTAAHPINVDAWSRSSCSTLIGLDADDKKYLSDGNSGDSEKPKRGLSARIAQSIRSLRTGGEDEDEDLGDPEKTTDLSTFLPTVTKGNGWDIRPQSEQRQQQQQQQTIASPAPTPITKDDNNSARKSVPRQNLLLLQTPPPAAVMTQSPQRSRRQSVGVSLEDVPSADARTRTTERAFRHRDLQLAQQQQQQQQQEQQQRQQQFPRDPVLPRAMPSASSQSQQQEQQPKAPTPGRKPTQLRVVSSPSFQPGQIVSPGPTLPVATAPSSGQQQQRTTMMQERRPHEGKAANGAGRTRPVSMSYRSETNATVAPAAAASVGRDRLKEMRAASGQQQQSLSRSQTRFQLPLGHGQESSAAKRSMTTVSGRQLQQQQRWSVDQTRPSAVSRPSGAPRHSQVAEVELRRT